MGRLYLCDNVQQKIWELNPDTLLVIGSAVTDTGAHTMGGMLNRIFTGVTTAVKELDPDTKLQIASGNTVAPFFSVGGIIDKMYYTGQNNNTIQRFDPDTFANIGPVGSTPAGPTDGVGGTDTRLYITNSFNVALLFEFDPVTLVNLSGAGISTPGDGDPTDFGGFDERLFLVDRQQPNAKLFEVDPNTLISISGPGVPPPGGTTLGLGGLKTATVVPLLQGGSLYPGNETLFLD